MRMIQSSIREATASAAKRAKREMKRQATQKRKSGNSGVALLTNDWPAWASVLLSVLCMLVLCKPLRAKTSTSSLYGETGLEAEYNPTVPEAVQIMSCLGWK